MAPWAHTAATMRSIASRGGVRGGDLRTVASCGGVRGGGLRTVASCGGVRGGYEGMKT